MSTIKRMLKCMMDVMVGARNTFANLLKPFYFFKCKITHKYGTNKWRDAFFKSLKTPLYDENLMDEVLILLDYSDDEKEKTKRDYERICAMIQKEMKQKKNPQIIIRPKRK